MSLRVLELDSLHLSNPDHHLKLSVISAADIRIPPCISSLADAAVVKALTSGKLWVSRGVACHLDIQVLFNGKPLENKGRVNLLESMGYRIRDAQLWTLLSLSASLDVWQNDGSAGPAPDVSINFNYGLEIPTPQTQHRAWVLDNFDIKPPDSVLCADFERMQIQFNFLQMLKKPKRVKRVKLDAGEIEAQEEMLLDAARDPDTYGYLDGLAHTVAMMGSLSSMVEQCFDPKLDFDGDPGMLQQLHFPPMARYLDDPTSAFRQDILAKNGKGNGNKNGRPRHPKATVETLNAWLQANTGNLHPSNAQTLDIMQKTDLSRSQIKNWFQYQRRKLQKGCSLTEDEMLLAQEENNGSGQQTEDQEEDETLLFQATDNTPSLTSRSSIVSSVLLTKEKDVALKRPLPGEESILLDKSPACELGEAAIQILMSGYIGRGFRGLGGIHVEKSPSNLSLASIAPSTFCPGFKELMAHNAQFLPTITHAISVSWPGNIQSPSLREKLSRLRNAPTSSLTHQSRAEDGEEGTTARLAAVIQSRLWGMMQRKLYDSADAAKIWRKSTQQENPAEDDEYPDLFQILREPHRVANQATAELNAFPENELNGFENLLSGDDDELVDYMEEWERLSVERETEEMLFGSGWNEDAKDEEDEYLLETEAEGDSMLL